MPPKRKSNPTTPSKVASSSAIEQPSSGGSSRRSVRASVSQKPTKYVEVDSEGNEAFTSEESSDVEEDETSEDRAAELSSHGKAKGKGKASTLANSKANAKGKGKMKGARNSKLEDNFVIEEDTNSDIADQDDLALSSDVSSLSDSDSSVPAPKKRKIQKWNGKTQGQTVGSSANERRSTKPSGNGPGRTVITLAKAPSKQPPPHIISDTMMNFLSSLKDPANNDRDWFQQHDALYRYAWDNWNAFVTVLLPRLMEEADETLPFLPTKDMVYRIYRDVRFSSDKTPYKTYMSATFSRGGRKGAYAGYHLEVKPGSQSFIAGGRWCPEKEHLQIFRQHIIDDDEEGRRFKEILNGSDFKNFFGPAKPGGRGLGRSSSVFGHSDELKVAPKMPGVDKNHPQIDWLKLRSFYVSRTFEDADVCKEDFVDEIVRTCKVMQPFVELLNDMIYPPPTPPSSDDDE